MSEKKPLNDEQLEKISGGDYYDVDKDTDPNNSMYKTGMWVELYSGDIHLWTEQQQIIDCRFKRGHWEYCFQLQPKIKFWRTATDIQTGTGKWEPHD